MSQKSLSSPNIQVNNDTVAIEPNTFKFTKGKGNVTVNPQSAGGNSVEMVISEDATTKKSMCSFEVRPTKDNYDLFSSWQDATDGVTIIASEEDFTVQFRSMYVTTDPEWNIGADQTVTIEFEGTPVV